MGMCKTSSYGAYLFYKDLHPHRWIGWIGQWMLPPQQSDWRLPCIDAKPFAAIPSTIAQAIHAIATGIRRNTCTFY